MEVEKLISLLRFQEKKEQNLADYYAFIDSVSQIELMSEEDLIKLSFDVDKYFNFILDSFDEFAPYVLHLYQTEGIEEAKERIDERFDDETFEFDMNGSNQNHLYAVTFLSLKTLFFKVLEAWEKGQDASLYFDKIDSILKSLNSSKTSIIIKLKNKNDLLGFLEVASNHIKENVQDEKLMNFDADVNRLVTLIENVIEIDSNIDIKSIILNKLASDSGFNRIGCYKNGLVSVIEQYANKGLTSVNLSGCTIADYNNLKNLLFDYIRNAPDYEEIVVYFTHYVSSYLNYYLEYDSKTNVCCVSLSNISSLFESIDCFSLILGLFMGEGKINFTVVNHNFVNKFMHIVQKLETYGYSKEEILSIIDGYTSGKFKSRKKNREYL